MEQDRLFFVLDCKLLIIELLPSRPKNKTMPSTNEKPFRTSSSSSNRQNQNRQIVKSSNRQIDQIDQIDENSSKSSKSSNRQIDQNHQIHGNSPSKLPQNPPRPPNKPLQPPPHLHHTILKLLIRNLRFPMRSRHVAPLDPGPSLIWRRGMVGLEEEVERSGRCCCEVFDPWSRFRQEAVFAIAGRGLRCCVLCPLEAVVV